MDEKINSKVNFCVQREGRIKVMRGKGIFMGVVVEEEMFDMRNQKVNRIFFESLLDIIDL